MTLSELIEKCKAANPGRKWAHSRSGHTVGVWVDSEGRYVPVYGTILGKADQWAQTPDLLVNGKHPIQPADWIPA